MILEYGLSKALPGFKPLTALSWHLNLLFRLPFLCSDMLELTRMTKSQAVQAAIISPVGLSLGR